jgi:hypothetical protein
LQWLYAPSYPTLESRIHRIKKSVQTLFLLKDADLDCEIIAIDGTFCAKPELVPIAIRRSNLALYFHMLVDY